MGEITQLLESYSHGDSSAGDRLYAMIYNDLTRLAHRHLVRSGALTLDPRAIVHELYLRTADSSPPPNRQQFFAYASAVMRSIVVDHLRERTAIKRGGGATPVTLNTDLFGDSTVQPEILDLDDALKKLKEVDKRSHDVVEMRFFGGMQLEEIADALNISLPTVKRELVAARGLLFKYLQP